MGKRALLVIDMLNDFIQPEGSLSVGPPGQQIVAAIARLVKEFRAVGEPIFYICDNHLPTDPEFEMFPPHCLQDATGAQIIDDLVPQDGDFIIPKRRYSAFYATQLDLCLRELKVEELVLVGVCTNICVLYTAADARNRTYRVTVPREGVASFDADAHAFALQQMETVLGVQVV